MQHSQTRYQDTLASGITSTALSLTVGTTAPTRTAGVLTLGRVTGNTEDVRFTAVAGTVVTLDLRGLSQTSLTPTEVAGNRKTHLANESVEITTHHLYDANKFRKDENETITGNNTFSGTNTFSGVNAFSAANTFSAGQIFSGAPKITGGLKDTNGNETIDTDATASAVNQLRVINAAAGGNVVLTTAGDDTDIDLELQAKGTGVVIVEDGAVTKTNAAPTTETMITNKKYVDDAISSGVIAAGVATHTIYTPAYMTGGLSPQTVPATWAAVTNGSFRATIDGTTYNFDAITFAAVVSMETVASTIQTKMRSTTGTLVTCTWTGTRFLITSGNTTSSSQVSVLTTSTGTVGTDISGAGASNWMDSDTGNGVATAAVLNQTADAGKVVLLDGSGNVSPDINRKAVASTGYSAKGSMMAASAANTPADVPVGANTFGLIADSSQSQGVKWAPISRLLGTLNTPVTVANTITETTLISVTVPANSLSTANAVMGRIMFYNFDSAAATTNDGTFRLYVGATLTSSLTLENGGFVNGYGVIDFLVTNNEATNVQKTSMMMNFSYEGSPGVSNSGAGFDIDSLGASGLNSGTLQSRSTAAIDTTADTTVVLKFIWGNADVGNTVTVDHGFIQLIA